MNPKKVRGRMRGYKRRTCVFDRERGYYVHGLKRGRFVAMQFEGHDRMVEHVGEWRWHECTRWAERFYFNNI